MVKLQGKLHIQKFEDFDEEGGNPFGNAGNFKKLSGGEAGGGSGAALFIEKPSRMNDMQNFDDGFDEEELI